MEELFDYVEFIKQSIENIQIDLNVLERMIHDYEKDEKEKNI